MSLHFIATKVLRTVIALLIVVTLIFVALRVLKD